MKMGKRQLVLAALVVALGAAVYLNWQLSGGGTQLQATQAVASGKELGETLMVNASGSAISSGPAKTASGSKTASTASGSKGAAVKASANAGTSVDEYFSEARLNRQKSRDEAVEMLEKVLNDAKENDEAKKEAVTQAAVIAQNTLKETNIENLIKAKGYSDCVVSIQNGECSVIVKTKASEQEDAIIIDDIVSGQTGFSYDKIKIIERQ